MKLFFYKALIILTIVLVNNQYSLSAAPAPLIERDKLMLTAQKVNREKYPDADSVLVWDVQKVTYQADGSSVEFDEFYQKILTEKGKRAVAVFSEYFNSSYGKVKIWAIEIIKANGKVIKIDVCRKVGT